MPCTPWSLHIEIYCMPIFSSYSSVSYVLDRERVTMNHECSKYYVPHPIPSITYYRSHPIPSSISATHILISHITCIILIIIVGRSVVTGVYKNQYRDHRPPPNAKKQSTRAHTSPHPRRATRTVIRVRAPLSGLSLSHSHFPFPSMSSRVQA